MMEWHLNANDADRTRALASALEVPVVSIAALSARNSSSSFRSPPRGGGGGRLLLKVPRGDPVDTHPARVRGGGGGGQRLQQELPVSDPKSVRSVYNGGKLGDKVGTRFPSRPGGEGTGDWVDIRPPGSGVPGAGGPWGLKDSSDNFRSAPHSGCL